MDGSIDTEWGEEMSDPQGNPRPRIVEDVGPRSRSESEVTEVELRATESTTKVSVSEEVFVKTRGGYQTLDPWLGVVSSSVVPGSPSL